MHIHILGIAGTFMSGLAIIAKSAGFKVTGQDQHCYPPVSDMLSEKGIEFEEGYDHSDLALSSDIVIIGNAIKRGMPVLETILNAKKEFTSGPAWLAHHILQKRRVIAISGTHGKTTTTAMLTHILREAGADPSFLIGGVAPNLKTSAHLGRGEWFIIEADEYDSAFFDKRPKLMHYLPEVAVINNLEFDHADIYPHLEDIQRQFHYFLRTIPSQGTVIVPKDDQNITTVLNQGTYSTIENFSSTDANAEWCARMLSTDGRHFEINHCGKKCAEVRWSVIGQFNVENALAAVAASTKAGISMEKAAHALASFTPIKRRLEVKATVGGITIYDDFAHHPTAIDKTIQALSNSQRHQRIIVVMEFASYTMRTGVHIAKMCEVFAHCNKAFFLKPEGFNLDEAAHSWNVEYEILPSIETLVNAICQYAKPQDAILVMSNRGFGQIHSLLEERLAQNDTNMTHV